MGVKESILSEGEELHKFIILLAHAGGEPVRGRTKLQKMLYLLSYAVKGLERGHYEPYNYGPYSEVVEAEKEYLENVGVLDARDGHIGLTAEGVRVAEALAAQKDPKTLEILLKYKEMFNDLTIDELLAYVYSAHPETASKSPKYKSLQPRMERLILSLLRKEKISSERATELLGKSYPYVLEKAGDAGIRAFGA